MIVRTYGRRNRSISGTYSDSLNEDVGQDSLSQESSQDPFCGFAFSSQDSSSHWSSFDSDPYNYSNSILPETVNPFDDPCNGVVSRKSKRARVTGKRDSSQLPRNCGLSIPATSTLMEAQEFGEMMEHVDEVNFALDGLRKGQPVRIRRASIVSLLSICATAQRRRLLRTQG